MKVFTNEHSDAMATAIHQVLGTRAVAVENRVCELLRRSTSLDVSSYEFWQHEKLGIFVPVTEQAEIEVDCPGSQCTVIMGRATLGAALSLMAINHQIWAEHDKGTDFGDLVEMQDGLKDYLFAEGSDFDAAAILTFID